MTLQGKVVLITGAARGIGAATARLAASRGARLSLVGLEPEPLAQLAAELGEGHQWYECDVTDQAALEHAAQSTVDSMGRLDVVVANAGIASYGTVAVTPVEALVRTIEVDLIGVVRTVCATLPYVVSARGYYLLVSSAAAFTVLPGMAPYSAAKAGVEQFGNALRLELAHRGVAVGTAHPIWVDTDMVRDVKADLPSFNDTLRKLPWPVNKQLSVQDCADAFVDAMVRRRRKVYLPRSIALVSALRPIVLGALGEWVLRRAAARTVPQLEAQISELGRSFGQHSTAFGTTKSNAVTTMGETAQP